MSLTLEMPTKKSPKKHKSTLIVTVIIILCIGAFVAWIYNGRIVSKNGELSAGFVPVPAPMSASLAEVLVKPNDYVQKDQLLAKLDAGDFLQQMAAAQALVRGTVDTSTLNAERVAAAQKAAEEMVERIALARHEENSRKTTVEKLSIEHAKAQLVMRNIEAQGGTDAQKDAAKKAEQKAMQRLNNAKASFEHASQSRTAIEAELNKIRNSQAAINQMPMAMPSTNPTLINAPINGYLTKNIPLAGQGTIMGEPVFQIIPEVGASLYAVANLYTGYAKKISNNTLCYVLPREGFSIFKGKVGSINTNADTASISINLDKTNNGIEFAADTAIRTVFWVHPLADIAVLQPLFMILSYLP